MAKNTILYIVTTTNIKLIFRIAEDINEIIHTFNNFTLRQAQLLILLASPMGRGAESRTPATRPPAAHSTVKLHPVFSR